MNRAIASVFLIKDVRCPRVCPRLSMPDFIIPTAKKKTAVDSRGRGFLYRCIVFRLQVKSPGNLLETPYCFSIIGQIA